MSQTLLIPWYLILTSCAVISARHVMIKEQSDIYQIATVVSAPLNFSCSVPICEGVLAPIYCSGKLIETSWRLGMQERCPGPKMRFDAEIINENFNKLQYPITKDAFSKFCDDNFDQATYLQLATLPDFVEQPAFLEKIKDPKIRKFAYTIHQRWKSLARSFIPEVRTQRDRYPVLPVPNPFIVPGGFFQVYFYWDSYWIMKGLVVSNLTKTVKGMLDNFAFVIDYHGFIPNSGNIQLSRRSQPPLFTQMVADYYFATKDKVYLREIIKSVEIELDFWRVNRTVIVENKDGEKIKLYQYRAITNCPRPENFMIDLQNGLNGTPYSPEEIWSSTASACESGWDFSSRWFDYKGSRAFTKDSIRTNSLIPVDVNSFMAWNFKTMAEMHKELGNDNEAAEYQREYEALVKAIDILWNDEAGVWQDYDLINKNYRNSFYPSNVFPLLAMNTTEERIAKLSQYLNNSRALDFPAGIPSTLPVDSHQQWDFPNVWAPNVHLFSLALKNAGDKWLFERAHESSQKFVTTVYNGLMEPASNATPGIWEKYDARFPDGRSGGGGEYVVQEGFGWTNGAVLHLIDTFLTESEFAKSHGYREMGIEDNYFGGKPHIYIVLIVLGVLMSIAMWFTICGVCTGKRCTIVRHLQSRRERRLSRPLLDGAEESD